MGGTRADEDGGKGGRLRGRIKGVRRRKRTWKAFRCEWVDLKLKLVRTNRRRDG